MSLIEIEQERQSNPVDVIEHIAGLNDWSFERSGEDEITISVTGGWTDYHVSFSWMEENEAIHLACAFDLKVPEARRMEIMRLLTKINLHGTTVVVATHNKMVVDNMRRRVIPIDGGKLTQDQARGVYSVGVN